MASQSWEDSPRRKRLESRAIDKKRELWENQKRFNGARSDRYVKKDAYNNRPTSRLLQWFVTADREDVLDRIANGGEDYAFLYYR